MVYKVGNRCERQNGEWRSRKKSVEIWRWIFVAKIKASPHNLHELQNLGNIKDVDFPSYILVEVKSILLQYLQFYLIKMIPEKPGDLKASMQPAPGLQSPLGKKGRL